MTNATPLTVLKRVRKDDQLVRPEGKPVAAQAGGGLFRPPTTHADGFGSLTDRVYRYARPDKYRLSAASPATPYNR